MGVWHYLWVFRVHAPFFYLQVITLTSELATFLHRLFFSYFFRWLLAKGRVEEARDEVRRGARLFRYLAGQSNHCGVFFRVTLDESLLHQKVASEPGKEDGAGVGADANNPRTPDIEVCCLSPTHTPFLVC